MIDIKKYVGAFTMDVLTACAFGVDVDSLHNANNPIVVNANKFFAVNASLSLIFSLLFPKFAKLLRLQPFDRSAFHYFDQLINYLTKKRVEENKFNNFKGTQLFTEHLRLTIRSHRFIFKYF